MTHKPSSTHPNVFSSAGKSERTDSLFGFPPELEHLLLYFGEDIISYGHNELNDGVVVNAASSSFFMSLGHTYHER
ncbi:hypothetical protein Y032_0119g812 [Ancylostoma ceylanicum]|uniref:Uncharacterized protein n=1 Tax=Ancylostoma ceylanicum TaxID=53326 RepID=A0A016TB33_9BILA|nr:hypothetical protein Y032_0119g812 [Ancylostoma ceylanicum]